MFGLAGLMLLGLARWLQISRDKHLDAGNPGSAQFAASGAMVGRPAGWIFLAIGAVLIVGAIVG